MKGWGEPPPAPVTVDNGTSAWGKPVDTGPSWGEPVGDTTGANSWGNASGGQQASNKAGMKVCGEMGLVSLWADLSGLTVKQNMLCSYKPQDL